MRIVASYSFKGGEAAVKKKYKDSFDEIVSVIKAVDADEHKTKLGKEKTMPGRILYNPKSLNRAFRSAFEAVGWRRRK